MPTASFEGRLILTLKDTNILTQLLSSTCIMYQASNATNTTLFSKRNFIQTDDGQRYEDSSSANYFQQPPVEHTHDQTGNLGIARGRLYDPNDDSISFALEEIGAALDGKDFIDLSEQKPTIQCNTTTLTTTTAQQYQQRYLVPNNNLINNTVEDYTQLGEPFTIISHQNNNQLKQQTIGEEPKIDSFYENATSVMGVDDACIIMQNYTNTNTNNNNNNLNLKNQDYIMNQLDDESPLRPYVEIVEQPAKCALRFRYKCEGRSAGSLPGVNSTADNKTYPSIRINNYTGRAVVVISCVTKDPPFKSHPHNIVGKEGCKKGICTIVMINNEENMVRSFSSLGIQCVKRKDIEESLSLRESIKVDPFRNGFAHKDCGSNIDLNVVRLCFQVFITGSTPNKCDIPLTPVVSDPIHDKKAMSDLVITKLSHCSAPATGGREVILLCDRISKDDIQIRFYEERDGKLVWETITELSPTDVHKQVAICFKTPKYHNENITQPVMARIQLKRLSDNQLSEPRLFQFLPCESDEDIISRKRQKIELFNMNHYALDKILQPNHQPQHPTLIETNKSPNQQRLDNNHHQDHRLQPQPRQQDHRQQNAQACMIASSQLAPERSGPSGPPTPLQPRRTSPIMQMNQQRHEFQPSAAASSRPPTRSPQQTLSPTQQQHHQHHQNNFMIDNQNLVVRREIIDNEGKVMRLVDRPQAADSAAVQNIANQNNANRPLDSSLDRIHISELMPDLTFNQNMDLNLGLGLSMHLNGGTDP